MLPNRLRIFVGVIAVLGISATVLLFTLNENVDFELMLENENKKLSDVKTESSEPLLELTGTPADNYPPEERETHCDSTHPQSNTYVKEYEIPTPCTQPLAIAVDSSGNVWFAETNTGNLGMFDPSSSKFVEYENELWPDGVNSMIWEIGYTDDGEIWFTDEKNDSLWRYSISEQEYSRFQYPSKDNNAFPQKIVLNDETILVNDFTGKKITLFEHEHLDAGNVTSSQINVSDGYYTSPPTVDQNKDIWFMIWKYQKEALLIKSNSENKRVQQFILPEDIQAPNGISAGPSGKIWISDTASSSFYSFDPANEETSRYITSFPPQWTFGNSSGLIKTPISRPYWNDFDEKGRLWINEQTANRLAVFDPKDESLIEYDIPSKNPNWADCGEITDCGLAQVFSFAFADDYVWFTEWVENNIGVLDTSIDLPATINVQPNELNLKKGESGEIILLIDPQLEHEGEFILSSSSTVPNDIIVNNPKKIELKDNDLKIPVIIDVKEETHAGTYKVLLGIQFQDVAVSSFVTVNVS